MSTKKETKNELDNSMEDLNNIYLDRNSKPERIGIFTKVVSNKNKEVNNDKAN